MARTSDVCLFTVATERFVPGAFVMIGTFLKHHPGFDGDVVVVQDGLSTASRAMLQAAFGRLRFEAVSPEMKDRAEAVRHLLGDLTASLYYLEAFRLTGYRKVLCCDSDLLFQGCIAELFDSTEALLCCGDRWFLRGQTLDAATGVPPVPEPAGPGRGDGERPAGGRPVLERTFNAGFLLVDARLRGEATYSDLLDMAPPEMWRDVQVKTADQWILNRYFAGRQTLVSWTYNYLLPEAAAIRAREGLDPGRAKVLHYVAFPKPWLSNEMLHWTRGDFRHRPAPEFKLWYDVWLDCLSRAWLRNARKGLAGAEHFRSGGFSATAAEPEPVPRSPAGRDAP